MKANVILPTSAEITRRLRTVAELRNLCLSLGRAKRAKDIKCKAELCGQLRSQLQFGNEGQQVSSAVL